MAKIYEPKGKAREYSPLALNYFDGCDHVCVYCYAKSMKERFNPNKKFETINPNIDFLKIEKSAKKLEGCGKQILLQFISDPYCNSNYGQTKKVLEILNKYNHKVSILSKGGTKCLIDIDIFKKFGERITVGQTLTFDNRISSQKWEPGASIPSERIKALKILKEFKIKTWASFEPVIDIVQSINMLKQCINYVDYVKIGKLNNYKGLDKKIDWAEFLDTAVNICREQSVEFYIKKDLTSYNKNTVLQAHEIDSDYLNL